MIRIFSSITFILITDILSVSAQNINNWILANQKIPVEKIYMHTDGENYFTGDTAWFKVYIIDSRSNQLIPKTENVYVRLVDNFGNTVLQSVLPGYGGQASGNFIFSENLKPGNYLIQAYTNYLFNFKPEAFFSKLITISKPSPNHVGLGNSVHSKGMVAALDFMPEGGVLLENITNLIAFKAISKTGYGVNAKGVIKDEKGVVITTFSSDYRGMGLLFLTPQSGKSYFATVEGFPSFKYKFEQKNAGIKIQLVNNNSKEVICNIAGNSESVAGKNYILASMYRGEVIFYQPFKMDGINKVFKFESNILKPGINKLVLLDENLMPVSERLLFSRTSGVNNIKAGMGADKFGKRSPVKLIIADDKNLGEENFSQLSVSVVNELMIPEGGFSENILSHLWINSEINGFVESSADLFNDSEISSEAKLRLVMLTIGYSKYFWNEAPGTQQQIKYPQEAGISLKGTARNLHTGKLIENGEITMAIEKDEEVGFLSQKTDSAGGFNFKGLIFTDTAKVHLQAKSESGKMNTDITIEPVFKNGPVSESEVMALTEKTESPGELAKLKYKVLNENRKNQPKKKVSKNQNKDTGHGIQNEFRLYKSADFVLEVDEFEQSYNNIIDYMVGKVPGVDISGNDIRIRGTGTFNSETLPLFLIDGVPLVENSVFLNLPKEVSKNTDDQGNNKSNANEQLIQTVKAIPLGDVEKVEVLKSAQNLSLFGTKGSNGVIAIYTRRGKQISEKSQAAGIIEKRVAGYATYKSFYSPFYTPENSGSKQPDLRILLYWNPTVTTKNGIAELNFFTSDLPGNYRVIIEGIASDGGICTGSAVFSVE